MNKSFHLVSPYLYIFITLFLFQSHPSISQKIAPTHDVITHDFTVTNIALSMDKKLSLTTDVDGNHTIRDLETGKAISQKIEEFPIYDGFFSNDESEINLITHTEAKSEIISYNYETKKYNTSYVPNIPSTFNIRSTISDDGRYIIFDNYEDKVLYGIESEEEITTNKFAVLYDCHRKKTSIIPINNTIDLFTSFDDKNNIVLHQTDGISFITKIINPENLNQSINEKGRDYKSIAHIISRNQIGESLQDVPGIVTNIRSSPDDKYIAVGGGENLFMWATGGANATVESQGFVSLWDVEKKMKIWTSIENGSNANNILQISDIQWINNYRFVAVDIAGNYHYYNTSSSSIEKQIIKPAEVSMSLDINKDFSKILFSSTADYTGIIDINSPDYLEEIDSTFNKYVQFSDDDNYIMSQSYQTLETKDFYIGNRKATKYSKLQDVSAAKISTNGNTVAYSSRILDNSNIYIDPIEKEDIVFDQTGNAIGYPVSGMMVYNEELSLTTTPIIDSYDPKFISGVQVVDIKSGYDSYVIESVSRGNDLQLSKNGKFISTHTSYDNRYSIFNTESKTWKYFKTAESLSNHAKIIANHISDRCNISVTVLDNKQIVIWNTQSEEIIYSDKNPSLFEDIEELLKYDDLTIVEESNKLIYQRGNSIISFDYIDRSFQVIYKIEEASEINSIVVSDNSKYIYIEYTTSQSEFGESTTRQYAEIINTITQKSSYKKQLPPSAYFGGFYYVGSYDKCYFHSAKNLAYVYNGLGELELYDLNTHSKLATVRIFENGDWLVYTPEGLFDANKNGRQRFYYIVDNEIILYEQIKERYWETDLLKKLINGKVDNPITELGVPLYPTSSIKLSKDSKSIEIELQERSGGIGKVNLLINNTLRIEDINKNRRRKFSYDLSQIDSYLYPKGINEISIRTYNKDGWINSRNNTIRLKTDLDAIKIGHKGFAETDQAYTNTVDLSPGLFGLFVGTSVYKNPKLNLDFSDDDAVALQDGFKKISSGMYDNQRVDLQLLTSGSSEDERLSSKENILEALNNIADNALPHDIIVLFFSGHGMTIDDDFYYLTSDAGTVDLHQDPDSRKLVTVSSHEILEKLKNIRSNKQVIVLDACHSGQITQILSGSTKALSTTQEKALEFLEDKMGVYILASSEANQKSFETASIGKGLLTFGLLRGMGGGAAKDSIINIIDLLNYASNEAEDIGKRVLQRTQRPVLNIAKGGSSFPIGFQNSTLKVPLPKNKIIIGESFIKKVLQDHIFHDPEKINKELELRLRDRGALGTESSFIYSPYDEDNSYTINGTYYIEDEEINVEWYILKNEEIFKGPFTKSKKIEKKSKLMNIIISKTLSTIRESETD